MPNSISILDVIKGGGFEASLFTTYNATLPFYEEVVLRRLVAAGCRHNVVLMDRSQCSVSWSSEATRPRLSGSSYTLLPIGAPGAFHPKICVLVGKKKASILVGSHNLTLSGFGYNREMTNWIDVDSDDVEGMSILLDVWNFAKQCIEMERGKSPVHMLDAALRLEHYIGPLVKNTTGPKSNFVFSQMPNSRPLLETVAEQLPDDIFRLAILGPFFDKQMAFVKAVQERWATAEVVVAIDPETVQLSGNRELTSARFVDARSLWGNDESYLHAKVLYFEAYDHTRSALVSGSANPSAPAWLAVTSHCNVEAVVMQFGDAARQAAGVMSLDKIFSLPEIDEDAFAKINDRSECESALSAEPVVPLFLGIVDGDTVRVTLRGNIGEFDRIDYVGADAQLLGTVQTSEIHENEIVFQTQGAVAQVRSCEFFNGDCMVARAMIHHPSMISRLSQSSRQAQVRSALGSLSGDGDISHVIASVERVIFASETIRDIEEVRRARTVVRGEEGQLIPSVPPSLAVSVADLPKARSELRYLKPGSSDLAYLLDILMRRLSEGTDSSIVETDKSGRTEEEQIGQDDEDERCPTNSSTRALCDEAVARAVATKAKALIGKMLKKLELATKFPERNVSAILQLIAVIGLIRELRHLDRLQRWRKTGFLLVDEEDRRDLMDSSLNYLLGGSSRLLEKFDAEVDEFISESVELRVLLLWLAWDLNEELTEQVSRFWEGGVIESRLRANAVFMRLLPPIVWDVEARTDLANNIARTVRQTPESVRRAEQWLERHWNFGVSWAGGFHATDELVIGNYCYVPNVIVQPSIVLGMSAGQVTILDFDRNRKFDAKKVVSVLANSVSLA